MRVPPPGLEKHGLAVVGVAGRRRSSRRRSSGRRPRSAAGPCRSGRPARSTRRCAQPSRRASSASIAGGVDVGEVAGRAADPGAGGEVGRLAGAAVVAGRLHVAQPQAGAGAEVRRGDVVVDEAVEDPAARRSARPNASPSAGAKSEYTSIEVSPDGSYQSAAASPLTSVGGVLGGSRRPGRGVGRLDDPGDLLGRATRCAVTEPAAVPSPRRRGRRPR